MAANYANEHEHFQPQIHGQAGTDKHRRTPMMVKNFRRRLPQKNADQDEQMGDGYWRLALGYWQEQTQEANGNWQLALRKNKPKTLK